MSQEGGLRAHLLLHLRRRSGDARILSKLEAYLEREEDGELRELIRERALGAKTGETGEQATFRQRGDGDEADSYERLPAPMRAMLRFQRAVQRCPRQVVRYAYGGKPLWSVAQPPACCPPTCVCGAPRTFELQLMPAALYVLRVDCFVSHFENGSVS